MNRLFGLQHRGVGSGDHFFEERFALRSIFSRLIKEKVKFSLNSLLQKLTNKRMKIIM
jgi:hypothetical protein